MAWTAPMTATSGSAFSAADFNTYVRDNFNETMPALATDNSNAAWFVADGANSIVKRNIVTDKIDTSEGTSSTSYTDLATTGPSVTAVTSSRALVMINFRVENNVDDAGSSASFAVSGATSQAALDAYAINTDGIETGNGIRRGRSYFIQTLTPGTNTFTMKYKVHGSSTATFNQRRIIVWSF